MSDTFPDKLQIFVSSTIKESAAERAVAKRAIESLNHSPILFEHMGARSAAPRKLYLSKLDLSHIFIGIYRNSYGWVAPGATRSGIDDEFRRSSQRGMPRLVYIHEPAEDRDDRLSTLLNRIEAEGEITFSRFHNADELYERIRQDVEAEVAKRFHDAERLEAIVRTDAAASVSGLVPAPNFVLPRKEVKQRLLEQLSTCHVLQVTGELGIGKTVLLASTAQENGLLFVSGTQLSNHELASVLANKIAAAAGHDTRYFADAAVAYSALLESWRDNESFTVVIDDCQDPDFVAALLKNVRGASDNKNLIYSIRNSQPGYGHQRFVVPPLSLPEVAGFLTNQGIKLSTEELDSIYHKSAGNPLYLLYFSQAPAATTHKELIEYELDAWRSLTPLAREVVAYLAIANQRISLAELLGLIGRRRGSVEEVTDALQRTQVFLTEFPNGYALRHEHQRITILDQLSANPSKFAYYSARVANLLKKRGDYLRAFFVLRQTDNLAAETLSRLALFDAQRLGDWKSQLEILECILEGARLGSDSEDLMVLLLSKAQALRHVGYGESVASVLSEADELAAQSDDTVLKLRAREARITYAVETTLTPENLVALQQLEQEYLAVGGHWWAARLATELAVLFTSTKRFSESVAASERGLKIFEELGDEYGISISLRNMATALADIPGRENESAALIEKLRKQQEKTGTRRERAWLCNYMVRTLRRRKQFPDALKYGKEAVQIAEELGDLSLAGTNRLNLGNVYRDMGELDTALLEYAASAELARKAGDKSLESSASRLTASIYRRKGNNSLALQHAVVAVNLVEGTFASVALSDALEEVGDCSYNLREWDKAAESYAKAAAISEDAGEKSRLATEALSTCVHNRLRPEQYTNCLTLAYGRTAQVGGPTQQMFEPLAEWPAIRSQP